MLPLTDDERTRMTERWQQENETNKVPAFLVDITQRLLCWNRYALYTSDLANHEVMEHAQGATLFDLIFSQSFAAITAHVANRDAFFLSMLGAIKAETQPFQDESWCEDMIANARRRYPSFDALWAQLPARVEQATVYTFGPLHVASPEGDLAFQLLSIPFGNDHRFRTVHYHPLNAATIRVWSQWLEQEE